MTNDDTQDDAGDLDGAVDALAARYGLVAPTILRRLIGTRRRSNPALQEAREGPNRRAYREGLRIYADIQRLAMELRGLGRREWEYEYGVRLGDTDDPLRRIDILRALIVLSEVPARSAPLPYDEMRTPNGVAGLADYWLLASGETLDDAFIVNVHDYGRKRGSTIYGAPRRRLLAFVREALELAGWQPAEALLQKELERYAKLLGRSGRPRPGLRLHVFEREILKRHSLIRDAKALASLH